MEEHTIEEDFKKYPYLKDMSDHILFVTKNDYDYIMNSPKITISTNNIPEEFIKRILNNNIYYDYAFKYFNNEIKTFSLSYIIYGDTGGLLNFNKSILGYALIKYVNNNKNNLTIEEQNNFNNLINIISLAKFKENYQDKILNISIENINYSIPISNFITFLELRDEDLNSMCISG